MSKWSVPASIPPTCEVSECIVIITILHVMVAPYLDKIELVLVENDILM